jgi:hypothetical protein
MKFYALVDRKSSELVLGNYGPYVYHIKQYCNEVVMPDCRIAEVKVTIVKPVKKATKK